MGYAADRGPRGGLSRALLGTINMLGKLSSLASEAVAAGKEKLATGTDNAVKQFLAELQTLQPLLLTAGFRSGGYRLVLSVPPRFEVLSDPTMDWNTIKIDEGAFAGVALSKYQEMIVSALRQAANFSTEVNARGFRIGKIDFELGIPPVITIDIYPVSVSVTV